MHNVSNTSDDAENKQLLDDTDANEIMEDSQWIDEPFDASSFDDSASASIDFADNTNASATSSKKASLTKRFITLFGVIGIVLSASWFIYTTFFQKTNTKSPTSIQLVTKPAFKMSNAPNALLQNDATEKGSSRADRALNIPRVTTSDATKKDVVAPKNESAEAPIKQDATTPADLTPQDISTELLSMVETLATPDHTDALKSQSTTSAKNDKIESTLADSNAKLESSATTTSAIDTTTLTTSSDTSSSTENTTPSIDASERLSSKLLTETEATIQQLQKLATQLDHRTSVLLTKIDTLSTDLATEFQAKLESLDAAFQQHLTELASAQQKLIAAKAATTATSATSDTSSRKNLENAVKTGNNILGTFVITTASGSRETIILSRDNTGVIHEAH